MIWFWVVVLVVVIGAVAVVAAGRGDAMADVYEDRPDMALERGRRLTAADVSAVRFTTAVRGYRMDEVDAFVARMEAELLAGGHSSDESDRKQSTLAGATGDVAAGNSAGQGDVQHRAVQHPDDQHIDDQQPDDQDVDDRHTDAQHPEPSDVGYADDGAGARRGDGTGVTDRT